MPIGSLIVMPRPFWSFRADTATKNLRIEFLSYMMCQKMYNVACDLSSLIYLSPPQAALRSTKQEYVRVYNYKGLVLGNPGTGKTSIVN